MIKRGVSPRSFCRCLGFNFVRFSGVYGNVPISFPGISVAFMFIYGHIKFIFRISVEVEGP